MTESTARAERIRPQSSTSSSYIWEVAQKPVSVILPYALIDRLDKDVVESFRSLTSRGSEIGGILVGGVSGSDPAVISVEEFRLIECDYSRGPLYRLSDADMGRFERAVEEYQGGSGLRVVGFFRSHTRKGLSLDAEDLAFLEARFRESHQMALLVRPYATKASTAGIFVREGGTFRGDASYQEFPFRSSQLTSFRPSSTVAEPLPAAPTPPIAPANVVAPALPAQVKPAARAQIVPIASRREVNLPPPPPAAEAPVEQAAPAVPVSLNPAPIPESPNLEPAKLEPAKAEPAKAEPAKAEPKAEEKLEAEAAPVLDLAKETGPFQPLPTPAETPKEKSKAGLVIGVLGAICLILTALFVYPGFLKQGAIPGGQGGSSLSLRVERTGSDILLTWNRDSEPIKNAQHAVLSIFDGDRHENYDMDMGQLRNGSIVYSPITADVSFRMDVVRQGKAAPISESVRVLRTRPSALGDGSQQQNDASKPNAPTAATPVKPEAAAENNSEAVPEEPKPTPVVATRKFDASSLSQRLRPASQTELDAPSINPTVSQPGIPGSISGLNLGGAAPAPAAPAPAAPAASAPKSVPSGGQIRQAELVSRKEPEYPKLARQMGVRGVVELTATVGPDGKVRNVRVEHGHPLLSKAATDAVMQWVYKPCLLNGQPVQSETRISLNFLGDR